MTARAIVLGLLGAAVICAATYVNDHVIRQTYLVGSGMPTGIYGGLIVFLLLVNPALAHFRKRWALTGAELAVVLALTLAACCIPSAGLMETFPDLVMMPHHINRTQPGWQAGRVLEMVPDGMLADVSGDDAAVNGYVNGMQSGTDHIYLEQVPWGAWTGTLALWLPMIALLWVALVGLSVVVHRQWSRHEQLSYPIATFAEALVPSGEGARGSVFRERSFWIACGCLLAFHAVNYTYAWLPSTWVEIPRQFDFTGLMPLFPTIVRGGGYGLFEPIVFFTIVGLAYVVPRDVSFSLGLGPYVYFFAAGCLAAYGIPMGGGGYGEPDLRSSLQAGAWIGAIGMIVYTGRHYYAGVLRKALRIPSRGIEATDVDETAVWGARAFLGGATLFAIDLAVIGLDWQLAIVYTLIVVGIFLVIGRISAETGYIFIQPYWAPGALMVGFLGIGALGPSTALLIFMLSTVLLVDTREALVPFLLNSFRLLERRKVSVGRTAPLCVAALLVGLAVAVPVTLYVKYDQGTDRVYGWASDMVPRMPFDQALKIRDRLAAQGGLEEAESISGFRRLLAISPNRTMLTGFTIGIAFVIVLSLLRLRFTWWPLHPVLLLLWATFAGWRFAASFLIGCFIKTVVVKYGGDTAYRRIKPVMFGLIAGDMLMGVTTSVIGGIYYLVTGVAPPRFVVLVG